MRIKKNKLARWTQSFARRNSDMGGQWTTGRKRLSGSRERKLKGRSNVDFKKKWQPSTQQQPTLTIPEPCSRTTKQS